MPFGKKTQTPNAISLNSVLNPMETLENLKSLHHMGGKGALPLFSIEK
jgi:hypothetical protein